MINRIIGILGLLLGAAALFVSTLYPSRYLLITGLAGAAAAGLVWFFIAEFESFRSFSRKRSTRLRLNSLLMVLFFSFILVLLNLILRQIYFRADFSTTGRYTLADQSRQVARSVDLELRLAFFGQSRGREFNRMRDLLAGYTHINRKIVSAVYDLDRSPALARRLGVTAYNTVVVYDNQKTLSGQGADEQTVTNLLLRVLRPSTPVIAFLEGQGERPFSGNSRGGLGGVASDLADMGFQVRGVDASAGKPLAATADLLVVAGPARALDPAGAQRVADYVDRGGKLMVLIDDPEPVRPLLAMFDLEVSGAPLGDPRHPAGADSTVPLVNEYFGGPRFMERFSGDTVFPGVHALAYRPEGGGAGRFEYLPFVKSSRESWLDANADGIRDDGEQESGRDPLAVVLKSRAGLSRIAVFGDVDFISNAAGSVTGNRTLFLNTVNWLLGEGRLLEIAPKERRILPMFITESQSKWVRAIPVAIPAVFAITGAILWGWRRRL